MDDKDFNVYEKTLRIAFLGLVLTLLFSLGTCAQSDSTNAVKLTYKGYESGAYKVMLESRAHCTIKVNLRWNLKDTLIQLKKDEVIELSLQGTYFGCTKIWAIPSNVCSAICTDPVSITTPCALALKDEKPVQINRNVNDYPKYYEVYDFTGRFVKKIFVRNFSELKQQLKGLPVDAYILKGKDTRKIINN